MRRVPIFAKRAGSVYEAKAGRGRVSTVSPLGHPVWFCLGACLSLAWRVMVPVSGRGSSSCSVTVAEDAPLDRAAGHLRSCSDLHGSGCARIQRSCSCGTTGRRICRSRGVSASLKLPTERLLRVIPRAPIFCPPSYTYVADCTPYGLSRGIFFFFFEEEDDTSASKSRRDSVRLFLGISTTG